MTLLWETNPAAVDRYRFALGSDLEAVTAAARVTRALEDNPAHNLVVIGPDVDLGAACELAEAERVLRPELGVILLRHRIEVHALSEALRSGIREVVQSDDQAALTDAVRRSIELTAALAGKQQSLESDGKVITVFSAKGGVGKTTLSTNVASYLASQNKRVLLIDLDLMFGDVAISLQLLPQASVRDVVAMSGHLDPQGLESVVVKHAASGLDVAAAPSDPADAERIPAHVVTELIRVARSVYDYVLIDTPPSFTEHVLAAIDVSDLTLLIATLDIPAVKNLRIALNTLDALGAPKDARFIVLNRSDAKVGLKASDVEAALQQPIAASVPNSLTVPASINRGVPIVLDEPKNPVSIAMRDLADREIRRRFGESVAESGKHINVTRRTFSFARSTA